MKTKIILDWISLFSFVFIGMSFFGVVGCNKTDSPFGVYAPNGLDNPYVSGSFNVSVQDNGAPVSGVNVLLVDAVGNTLFGQTATSGIASFNPGNIMTGTWNAIVPTQSVTISSAPLTVNSFYQSVQPVAVSSSGLQNVYFSSGVRSISVSPVSINYSSQNGSSYPVSIKYSQAVPANIGILNVPVSITMATSGSTFSLIPFALGNGINVLPVSVSKNFCYMLSAPLTFTATDFGGSAVTPGVSVTMYRGYKTSIQALVNYMDDGSGNSTANLTLTILTDSTDCGQGYSFGYSGPYASGSISNIYPAIAKSIGGISEYGIANWIITTPIGTTFTGSWNTGNWPLSATWVNSAY